MDDTILRQWTLLRSIPNHPRRIATTQLQALLSETFGTVSLRTIQRDLNKLSLVFQIEGDQSKPQGWSWRKDHKLDVQTLDPATALTFNLAELYLTKLLPPAATSQLKPWFNAARNLSAARPSSITRWQDKIRVIPHSPFREISHISQDVQDAVYEALQTERMLEITYQAISTATAKTYPVHPLAIVVRDSTIYLVGRIRDYDDIRILAIHRITNAVILDQPVIFPSSFAIDDYLEKNSFQITNGAHSILLQLIVTPPLARFFAEAPVSADQEIDEKPDGNFVLKATDPDSVQLRSWLLSLGESAAVVAPASLRADIKAAVESMIGKYGANMA